jgi:hypothetical protein
MSIVYPKLFTEDGEYGHHRYIDIGEGKTFHAVEAGNINGPLIIFLHGFPQVSPNICITQHNKQNA